MTQRYLSAVNLLLAGSALLIAILYFQNHLGLEACNLCLLQRAAMVVFVVVMLISLLHNRWAKLYGGLGLLAAGTGIAIASRHVWLQSLPEDQVPACGPPMEFLIEAGVPWLDIIAQTLQGSGNCAAVSWEIAGLSIPALTLIVFVVLALASLLMVAKARS